MKTISVRRLSARPSGMKMTINSKNLQRLLRSRKSNHSSMDITTISRHQHLPHHNKCSSKYSMTDRLRGEGMSKSLTPKFKRTLDLGLG
ncbi:hypothetical protein FGO68_gene15150 [Halteria grandinella]|uniref:Uncharacterized protein n=1 Tax=Halteria grandinella TaxID=5974 RepID=A0A8J8NQP4_HALGN|nr:hypothetical protein FGO68_gene15150 [Halteria grandinella]